jgi:hypothetical protein
MPSSGMLRRVFLVRTDVSEERSTSIIRVTRIGELGTTLAVTSNRRTVRVPGCLSRSNGFDSRRYQIFCVAVGMERGPLSLARINEELLERKEADPVLKTEINGRGGSATLTTRHPSIRKS